MRSGKYLLILGLVYFTAFSLAFSPGLISPYLENRAHAQIAQSFVTDEGAPVVVHDPNERFNRAMFQVNDKLYFYAIKPAGTIYSAFLPPGVRGVVRNGYFNWIFPVRLVNSLLQGKGERAGTETLRFVINSTMGIGGLFDYADYGFGIQKPPEEDFGQTLAVWGAGPGPYMVVPLIGPTNVRDLGGYLIDSAGDATMWIPMTWWISPAVKAGKVLNNSSLRIGEYEDFKKSAIDPYVSLRSAYQQYRTKEIAR